MEKINDILKPLIGILLIFSFILAFSSCEQKPAQEVLDKDSVEVETEAQEEPEDTTSWRTRAEQEGKEMDARFDSLKAKAKVKGKKAEQEVNETIEKLRKEKEDIVNDQTGEKVEDKWEKFKEKTKDAIDSLDKKI